MTSLIPRHAAAGYAAAVRDKHLLEAEPTPVDGRRLRQVLHHRTGIDFLVPRRHFTGWWLDSRLGTPDRKADTRVLVTWSPFDDTGDWVHASISHHDRMPTYEELTALHAAVFDGYAYQVFAPPADHVNIHPFTLHLWGRLDGVIVLPDFGREGTI